MAEYIDREKLIAEYDRVHVGPAGGARKLMVDAPTADVVEVVRCKDCKYCKIHYPSKIINEEAKKVYSCNVHWHSVRPDGYCNFGERAFNEVGYNEYARGTV